MQKSAVQLAFPSLKAAAESKEFEGVSKVTSFAVHPKLLLVEEDFNARPIDWDHVERLCASLFSGGVFPDLDIRVDAGKFYVVDGHHRREAALLAIERGLGLESLPCKQFRGDDGDRIAHMLATAENRLALTPLQLGVQVLKLIRLGWDEKRIADRLGRDVQYVRNALTLAESNTDVKRAIEAGEIGTTAALQIVKQHGTKAGAVIKEKTAAAKAAGRKRVTIADVQAKPKLSDVLALLREMPAEIEGEWAGRVRALVGEKGGAK